MDKGGWLTGRKHRGFSGEKAFFGAGRDRARPHRSLALALLPLALPLAPPLALSFVGPAAYAAQAAETGVPLSQLPERWHEFPARAKFRIIEQLIRMKRLPLAERLLDQGGFGGGGNQLTALFYRGVLYKNQGRHKQAASLFRKILAQRPDYVRVRLELGHTLFLMREDESARHHLDLVRGGSKDPKLEKTIRYFIDMMDRRKSLQFSAYASVAPSTNVNQGTDEEVIYINGLPFRINDGSRKKSGVGALAGGTAGYRKSLGEQVDALASIGVHLKEYAGNDFDSALIAGQTGLRFKQDGLSIAGFATGSRSFFAQHGYNHAFGGRIQLGYQLSPRDILFNDSACQHKWHDKATWLDGFNCTTSLGFKHYFSSRTAIDGSIGGEWERTTAEHLQYDAAKASIGLYHEFGWGITAYASAAYQKKMYKFDYPALGEARIDDRYEFSLNMTKRDLEIMGFAPSVNYTYTHNESNAEWESFSGHSVSLTFTKKF